MTTGYAPAERFHRYAQSTARTLFVLGSFPLVKLALVLLWAYVLWSGEKGGFRSKISSCRWEKWEKWVCLSTQQLALLSEC